MNTMPEHLHPLVVSYGGGVDSTAMLVGFKQRGIRPDMIVFADVGGEHPETYAALTAVDAWLRSVGFPRITRVKYYSPTTRYQTLEGNCLQNDGLPSLAYGGHSCSLKWKIEAIDDFVWGVRGWEPAFEALAEGHKVTRCIGYDYGCADSKRFAKMDKKAAKLEADGKWSPWQNWYPLRDWEWGREECEAAIMSEAYLGHLLWEGMGRCVPFKSSCFFCPAMKVEEVEQMARLHPELALRAAVMEYRAETGKHGLETCNGLGLGKGPKHTWDTKSRNWSWHRHLVSVGLLPEDWLTKAKAEGLVPAEWDAYIEESRPYRQRVEAARAQVEVETERLPASFRKKLTSKGIKELHKKAVESRLRKAGKGAAWIEARVALKAAEKAKKELLPPDWRVIPQPKVDPEVRRQRAAAKKRWREACAFAQKLQSAKEGLKKCLKKKA
jgi:hypothetical protein